VVFAGVVQDLLEQTIAQLAKQGSVLGGGQRSSGLIGSKIVGSLDGQLRRQGEETLPRMFDRSCLLHPPDCGGTVASEGFTDLFVVDVIPGVPVPDSTTLSYTPSTGAGRCPMVVYPTLERTNRLINHTLNCDGIVTGWGAYSCISVHLFVDSSDASHLRSHEA